MATQAACATPPLPLAKLFAGESRRRLEIGAFVQGLLTPRFNGEGLAAGAGQLKHRENRN